MYKSMNEPQNFYWHDAEISQVCCKDDNMIWKVDALNVLSCNSQNPKTFDLCAGTAEVIFEHYHINSITSFGFKRYQGKNLVEEQPDRALSHEEIKELLNELICETDENYVRYIYEADSRVKGTKQIIYFTIDLMIGFYTEFDTEIGMEIVCDKFIVQWDEYAGEPWYSRL